MTPREVLARHTSRELSDWRRYFRVEPSTWDALNLIQAMQAARQSDGKHKIEDFLIDLDPTPRTLEDRTVEIDPETLRAMLGAKPKRHRKG